MCAETLIRQGFHFGTEVVKVVVSMRPRRGGGLERTSVRHPLTFSNSRGISDVYADKWVATDRLCVGPVSRMATKGRLGVGG